MSSLSDIGVKVEGMLGAGEAQSPHAGNARAILHEIQTRLAELVAGGQPSTIDLRAMPLAPGDYETLQRLLGEGEVAATVEALGPTRVRETAIRGVWWVTHCNADEEIVADLIEITSVPSLLQTVDEDLLDGLSRLRERLAREQHPASESEPKGDSHGQ